MYYLPERGLLHPEPVQGDLAGVAVLAGACADEEGLGSGVWGLGARVHVTEQGSTGGRCLSSQPFLNYCRSLALLLQFGGSTMSGPVLVRTGRRLRRGREGAA